LTTVVAGRFEKWAVRVPCPKLASSGKLDPTGPPYGCSVT